MCILLYNPKKPVGGAVVQNVTRKEIAPGVNLTTVSTYKFKTGCLSMTLVTRLQKKTASLNAVLPYVLRRGTAKNPDMVSIERQLDDLYGARIEPVVRKKGETQCVGFYADFPDDAYLPGGSSVLEKTAELMGEMLLSPATRGGRLIKEYVDRERENLLADLYAEINDKRYFAAKRLNEIMCSDEAYGVSKLGTVSEAQKISVYTLTNHYRELLASSNIELFYCGSADADRVENVLRYVLSALPRRDKLSLTYTDVKFSPDKDSPTLVTEQMNVSQGKLVMGYRIGDAMREQLHPAMIVFNAVFGGSVTSKLFMNVREKLSLCYYANSAIDRHKGVMVVSSGIEFDKYDEVYNEITAQLEAIKQGKIDSWELEGAKKAIITAISSSVDSPVGLESMYLDSALNNLIATPENMAALVSLVTKEDVVRVAKGVTLDTVYFLTGEGDYAGEERVR